MKILFIAPLEKVLLELLNSTIIKYVELIKCCYLVISLLVNIILFFLYSFNHVISLKNDKYYFCVKKFHLINLK